MTTPDDLRAMARELYEVHAAELGLDAWRGGTWRDGPPSARQRAALMKAAGTTLEQLDVREAETVRAVAMRPDLAGRGAVHDCLAVTFGLYQRMKDGASQPSTPARRGPASQPHDRPPARSGSSVASDAARRLALVEALLDAPEDRLDAVARVLGAALARCHAMGVYRECQSGGRTDATLGETP